MSLSIAAVTNADASADMELLLVEHSPAIRTLIQVSWTGLTGTLDGVLTVYAVSRRGHKSVVATIDFDVDDNTDDVHSVQYSGSAYQIGLEYQANNVSTGSFNIDVTRL